MNSRGGGVKETIESILVAFILAFVFRAFVVEAFVIPTGSMATTLLGAHTRYHCPDCGYSFDVNYSSVTSGEDEDVNVPATAGLITTPIYCPNCGFRVPAEQVDNPPIAYGDRILVLKYLYLLGPPKRWDVVVFKAPEKPNQNYIKRLTGLPGEAVMILDGDVYTRAPGDPDPKHFTVQPKPPGAQSAMWRLVYDNDYHPAGAARSEYPWQQPWHVSYGTGCRQDDPATHGRVFTFDTPAATTKLAFDPLANPAAQGFTDYLVANQNTHQPARDPETRQIVEGPLEFPQRYPDPMWVNPTDIPVSDLDLRLTYQRTAGTGPFAASMTKRGHTFTAELTGTTATLYHDFDGNRMTVGRPFPLPSGHGAVRVDLSNADYRATLRINDAVVAQTTPEEYHPNLPALLREYQTAAAPPLPAVALRADDQQSRVSHLSLWRDVYYYDRDRGVTWATPRDFPAHVQQLGNDEYFTMGDNSQLSWDARCWTEPINLPASSSRWPPAACPAGSCSARRSTCIGRPGIRPPTGCRRSCPTSRACG